MFFGAVRRLKRGGLLVQTNHHVAPCSKKRDEVFGGDEESVLGYSKEREDALRGELMGNSASRLP